MVAALKPQAQQAQQPAEQQQQQQTAAAPPLQHHSPLHAAATATATSAASLTLGELRGWAAARLPPYQLPAELRLVAAIPRNALGKVNKRALRQQLFGDPSPVAV